MSLFAELKRRNVFKVAVAYLVMAWLVMQVTDVILNNVEAPGWIFHVIMLVLGIGFLLAIFFAWEFELTPEGLKKEKDVDRSQSITHVTSQKLNNVIIGLLVLALGYFVYDKFVLDAGRDAALVEATTQALSEQAAESATEVPVDESPSIAVLPFVNMSSDTEQEYFSDGLSEELLNLLAKIPDLRVTSRSSAFFYKGKDIKIAEVGRELNVANVLEGSVRKAGNQIRVTAQLIRVADDVHLWSETYDRSLEDVFAIQDEIAANVVDQLKLELLGEAPQVIETDPEAYALFLQARELGRRGSEESLQRALELHEQSLAIDSNYTPAWHGMGVIHANLAQYNLSRYESENLIAREMAEKALSIDPDYAESHALLGWVAMGLDDDQVAAAQHFQRAHDLEPGNINVVGGLASFLFSLGRLEQGLALDEFLLARDPISVTGHHNIAVSYLAAGRYDDAIRAANTALALSPGRVNTNTLKAKAQLFKGNAEMALQSFELEPIEENRLAGLSLVNFALGRYDEADQLLEEYISNYGVDYAYNIASIYAYRGEKDAAFEWLDKEIERFSGLDGSALTDPLFENLRSDPRWSAMLEREGKSPALLESIKLDITLPSEQQLAEAAE